ncbi:MAG: hypothetical protein ACFCU2_12460 [Acidimicrobiia bacterium]
MTDSVDFDLAVPAEDEGEHVFITSHTHSMFGSLSKIDVCDHKLQLGMRQMDRPRLVAQLAPEDPMSPETWQ